MKTPRYWWEYQFAVLDQLLHEPGSGPPISYRRYLQTRRVLQRLKRTDPGGDIRL